MKYFKVKQESDQVRVNPVHFLIADELYTEREKEKLKIPEHHLDCVEVSRKQTFWFFGARYAFSTANVRLCGE